MNSGKQGGARYVTRSPLKNFTHHQLNVYEEAKYLRIVEVSIRLLSRPSLDLDVRGRLEVVVLVVSLYFLAG